MALYAASALITFLLQTTAEWTGCVLLVRVVRSPRVRFRIWLAFFLAVLAQWVWFWVGIADHLHPTLGAEALVASHLATAEHRMILSTVWDHRLGTILAALGICYGAVLCGLLMRTAQWRIRLQKALRHKAAPSGRLSEVFNQASLIVPSRTSELWVLPGLASPATFGWRHPQVIVPFECEDQNESDLEAIFCHELTHVQRGDAFWNAVVRGCRNLLWFHPCMHHALNAINTQRELACDRTVVEEYPVGRDVYAACLLRFARLKAAAERTIPCVELTSGANFLNLRIRSILAETRQVTVGSTIRRVFVGLTLVGAMLVLTPGLRILLTTVQARPVLGSVTPNIANISAAHPKGQRTRHSQRPGASVSTDLDVSSPQAPEPFSPPSIDPALAASHRVGMAVLTQSEDSGGLGQAEKKDPVDSGQSNSIPSTHQGMPHQPSWTKIALGAAGQLNNVDFDHDHDRH